MNKSTVLGIIPARGGSKGIPRKNIQELGGKPLIAWTIEAAKGALCIDRIIVSTEDEEIAAFARALGAEVPFIRPLELAADDTPGIDPIHHAIKELPGFDWALMLQPTSPFRTSSDIDGIFNYCQAHAAPSAVSVCEAGKHPYWMYQRDEMDRLQPVIAGRPEIARRQDLPSVYALNGALYLGQTDWLLKHKGFVGQETIGYVMPGERSLDLDTVQDWEWAEYLLNKIKKTNLS